MSAEAPDRGSEAIAGIHFVQRLTLSRVSDGSVGADGAAAAGRVRLTRAARVVDAVRARATAVVRHAAALRDGLPRGRQRLRPHRGGLAAWFTTRCCRPCFRKCLDPTCLARSRYAASRWSATAVACSSTRISWRYMPTGVVIIKCPQQFPSVLQYIYNT